MKIVATIEARMGSTRLPGKVLANIGRWSSLELQIGRLKRSGRINEIVLATTVNREDDVLEEFAMDHNVSFFRGSEQDILTRILGAASSFNGDLLVQVTGDCPLIDPEIIDDVIYKYLELTPNIDFVSNEINRTYPIGLDCRVLSVDFLRQIDEACDSAIHRSHGTTYVYASPESYRFRCFNIEAKEELRYPNWRWTLDTIDDLLFFRRLYDHFGNELMRISAIDLATWLRDKPEVLMLNSSVQQKRIEDG
jgi:spore coat polysaccharide biosynthesis protein SpsF